MGIILGLVGLVALGFVVATISGVFSGVRTYRSELQDPDAIHRMGVESLKSGNVKAAVLRFEHASKMGHAGSAFNLGLMFGNGMGFQKDMSEAFKWFKLAADRGLAQGHLNVGGLYLHGDGVEKNLTNAYHYIRIAADEGLEQAIALAEEFEATLENDWSFVAQIDEKEWLERRHAVLLHLRGIGTVDCVHGARSRENLGGPLCGSPPVT